MASTMLTGDKRWAPTRKSGMTVLGKVPKPLNLPSQRSENHGLDPNVEIVPKGTLTWGSRSASTVPNVWTSSALLSPNTDGSSGSPSHLDGRPSSGSGTRPSTAGSEKSHEPASNAWCPNLRPSSASGSFASNQSSVVSNRPRSAEARPSSAQLSRFAETPADSTVAWGPKRAIERVGAASKSTVFTLEPTEFPTLGSDKTSESQIQRGHSSHGRPNSSSGTTAVHKEAVNPLPTGNQDPYTEHSSVDSWKRDGYSYVGGCPPNMNWHRDPQQAYPYTGGNIPPQHVGSWQSSPIHSPDGVWHRGGVVGGPYRPSGPQGGYPMEPYACYPQYSTVSGPFRPSSEPVPKPGAVPGGFYHPKNGEPYQHHQLPDSYFGPSHPVIPVRPGVYPHILPYEGYYGPPPASFHSPTESDKSVRGMPNQFGVYEHAKGNVIHDPEKFHVMPDRHASLMNKEHKQPSHPHETHPGQFKVLLKHHDSWEDRSDPQDKRVKSVLGSLPQLDRGVLQATSYDEQGQRSNHGKDDRIVYVNLRSGQEASSQRDDMDCCSRDSVIVNRLVIPSSETNDSLMTTPDNITSPATENNVSLVEKEVLNNKACSSVGHSRADEKSKYSGVSRSTDHSTKDTSAGAAFTGHVLSGGELNDAFDGFVSHDGNPNKIPLSDSFKSSDPPAPIVGKSGSSGMAEKTQSHFQKREHVLQGRTNHIKSRSDRRDTEWVNNSSESNNLVRANMANDQSVPGFLLDSHASKGAADESLHSSNIAAVTNLNTTADITDHKAQRAKLKEIALRRAKELQEEEEERTREQRAKALAKLEELNRRTLAHGSNQKKNDLAPINDVPQKQEEGSSGEQRESTPGLNQNSPLNNAPHDKQGSEAGAAVKADAMVIEAPTSLPAESSNLLTGINDVGLENSAGSTDLSGQNASHVLISDTRGTASPSDESLSLESKNTVLEVVTHPTCSNLQEGTTSKRKQTGSRRRPHILKEENLSDKPTTAESITVLKNPGNVSILTLNGDNVLEENAVHHKKKSNRNARNKTRTDEALISSTSPTPAPTNGGLDIANAPLTSVAKATQDPAQRIGDTAVNEVMSFNQQGQSQAAEKVNARVDPQWKPQSTKKSTKSQQVRNIDKTHGNEGVIWAPVRPSNQNEPSGEINKSNHDTKKIINGKKGHDEQSGIRTKRAEMERYVPKAVAKELSQQNLGQPSPPLEQAASGSTINKSDSGSNCFEGGRDNAFAEGKHEADTRDGEGNKPNNARDGEGNKHNKRGKVRSSWRQRISAESSSPQNSTTGALSDTKPMTEPSEPNPAIKNVSLPETLILHDNWNGNQDNIVPTEKLTVPVIKDQQALNRQRRQQHPVQERKHQTPLGNNDLRGRLDDTVSTQFPVLGLNESHKKNASRVRSQNVGGDQMRTQWQPKSHGIKGVGEQETSVQEGRSDKDSQLQGNKSSFQNERSVAAVPKPNDSERQNVRHQENYRGRHSMDQQVSSAAQQHGPFNDRSSQRQETTYRGRGMGHNKQNLHTNVDKRWGNTQYEYQPIGSRNTGDVPFHQINEAYEGPRATGTRYRERSQQHPRRGDHSYGQRSAAAVQVGDPCNYRD